MFGGHKQRVKQLRIANKEEDKTIRRFEKKLKLHKRKATSIPKSFVDDGLDYLLEVCSAVGNKVESAGQKRQLETTSSHDSFSEDDSDSETNLYKRKKKSDASANIEPPTKTVKPKKVSTLTNKWDVTSQSDNTKTQVLAEKPEEEDDTEYQKKPQPVISIRKPLFSNQNTSQHDTLKKKLKGLINKVTEMNLLSILNQIETVFHENVKQIVQQVLNEIIVDSLVQPASSPEKLIYELVIVISALHVNIGSEIGSSFLEAIVKKFDNYFTNSPDEGKQLDNLLVILASLYNYGVTSACLAINILEKLSDRFSSKDIELITKFLRTTGASLRRDEPTFLKQLILNIKSKIGSIDGAPPRTRFLIDTLSAITNNNVAKICSPTDLELLEHYRKLLKTVTKKGESSAKINVPYDDLLSADVNGRWWLVGSAWTGETAIKAVAKAVEKKQDDQPSHNDYLDKARLLRLNTEVRREIFCTLMSAEDYLDASEKVLRLGLKPHQEKEILFVAILCCIKEANYNPYYTHVVQKLIHVHRRFRMAATYAIWDHLKSLSSNSRRQASNLAKLLAHLVGNASLDLSVIKVFDFTQMNSSSVHFLRQFLKGNQFSINKSYFNYIVVVSRIITEAP